MDVLNDPFRDESKVESLIVTENEFAGLVVFQVSDSKKLRLLKVARIRELNRFVTSP